MNRCLRLVWVLWFFFFSFDSILLWEKVNAVSVFFFLREKVIRYRLSPFPTLRQKFNACSPLYMDCKFGFSVTDFLSQDSF